MFKLVPKPMVSVNAEMGRRLDLSTKETSWADSGAFHLIKTYGRYPHSSEQYEAWLQAMKPKFFTQMDWPCEPDVIASTGLKVGIHQTLSLESAMRSREFEIPGATFVPTIQGWAVEDYLAAAAELEMNGLWERYMAVGSICRRGQVDKIIAVLTALREFSPKTRFHGFGVKSRPEVLELLHSADSFAWRYNARKKLFAARGSGHEQMVNLVPFLNEAVEKGVRWEGRGTQAHIQRTLRPGVGVTT